MRRARFMDSKESNFTKIEAKMEKNESQKFKLKKKLDWLVQLTRSRVKLARPTTTYANGGLAD